MAIDGQLTPRYMNMRAAVLVANAQGDLSQETAEVLEHISRKLTVVPYYYNPSNGLLEIGRQCSTSSGGGAGSSAVDANLTTLGGTKQAGYFSLTPTTPGSSNDYLWVRTVGSAAGSTVVDLSSGGSTKLVGKVELSPTTPGSSNDYLWVRTVGSGGAGSTIVDINSITSSTAHIGDVSVSSGTIQADLTSAGSTKLVGLVGISGSVSVTGTTSVSLSSNPGITSGASEVAATSVGSTKVFARVDVNNTVSVTGTTAVSISGAVTADLSSAGSTRSVGTVNQGSPAASSADAWWVRTVSTGSAGAGSTTVDANLTSDGSTREVGIVALATSTGIKGAVSLATAGTTATLGQVAISNPTTSVTVSSGLVLGPSTAAIGLISSGTQTIGTVLNATSTGVIGAVSLATAGTTATLGQVAISNPTTSVTVTSGVVLGAGSSANTIGSVALVAGATGTVGAVAQGSGSSANHWFVDSLAFTSANTSRSTINTTVDISIVAANANRKALVLANLSTLQIVGVGLSTGAVTTAGGNVNVFLPPQSIVSFGLQGGFPNFVGPMRGINLTSTTVAGGIAVTQFINT